MSLLLSAAAVMLIPVAFDDPILAREDSFVSEAARTAIADGTADKLHCLDMPQGNPDGARVCLTSAEWQSVFDRIAHNESADRRERAVMLADIYLR